MGDITGSSTPCARAVSKIPTSGCPLRWRGKSIRALRTLACSFLSSGYIFEAKHVINAQTREIVLAVGAVGGSSAHGKAHSAPNQDFFSYGSLERHVERGPIEFEKCSALPKSGKRVERMAVGSRS